GALHVENGDDRIGHTGGAPVSAGLEQNGASAMEQCLHERIHLLLEQRLAAGHLDERAVVSIHSGKHGIDGLLRSLVERVRRVAPRTSQVAGGEAHEDARTPRIARLALHRVEDLVNREQSSYYPVSPWERYGSAHRAGTTRRGRAPGTGSST